MAWLGDLVLRLKAETADFQQDMGKAAHQAERSFRQIQTAAAGLGVGLSALGLGLMIKSTIDAADKLNDLSKSTKIAADDLAGIGVAAKQSGGDVESAAQSINKLMQNMGKEPEKFKALGITAKEPLEAFKQFAEVFRNIENPQLRAALGAEALGKSWAGAAPLLMEGGRQIGELVEQGKKLSGITPEFVRQADEFNDNLTKIGASANAAKIALVGPFMTALIQIGDEMVRQAERGEKFAGLVKGLAQAAGIMDTETQRANREAVDAVEKMLYVEQKLAAQEASLGRNHPVTIRTREMVKALREAAEVAVANARLMRGEDLFNAPGSAPAKPSDAAAKAFMDQEKAAAAAKAELGLYEGAMQKFTLQLGALNQMTVEEQSLYEVTKGSLKALSGEHAAMVMNLAVEIDRRKQLTAVRKSDEAAMIAAYDAEAERDYQFFQDKLQRSKDLAALTKKSEMENIEAYVRQIEAQEELDYEIGQIALKKIKEDAKKTADMARALGMTFSSAFEDAIIKGKGLQDVLRGIADDLLRIALRKTVTEPMATSFSGLLGGLDLGKIFGGGATPAYSDPMWGSVMGPYATGTDSVPHSGLAWVDRGEKITPAGKSSGGTTIQQTISFGSDVNRATMIQWAAMVKEQTIAAVVEGNRRNRYSFS